MRAHAAKQATSSTAKAAVRQRHDLLYIEQLLAFFILYFIELLPMRLE